MKINWSGCPLIVLLLLAGNGSPQYDADPSNLIFDNTCLSTSDTDEMYFQSSDVQVTGQILATDSNKILRWKSNVVWISSRQMNKHVKIVNGNRTSNSNLNIIHWNGGSRKWQNKRLEIESLLLEKKPDLCFVSEANLWEGLDSHDTDIPGYTIHLPNTIQTLKHARLVLLARHDLLIQVLTEKTDREVAMIWVKVGTHKKSSILIDGIYRQHKLLSIEHRDVTKQQLLIEQERRWEKIIKKWKTISRITNCVVIGDLNLDHLRWSSPEQHLESMVDQVKDNIETCGFLQLITGHTQGVAAAG